MIGSKRQSHQMGRRQAQEANRATDGDRRADHRGREKNQPAFDVLHRHAEMVGLRFAEGQRIQRARKKGEF